MKSVTQFEANLLRVLHCLLGRAPVEQALPIILAAARRPRCLSRDAIALVQDALAKGCVQWLARCGGWRRERFLRGEGVAEGRLWERTQPAELALRFSRHSLAFLMWLTAARPVTGAAAWQAPRDELTPADWLLFFLAHQTLRGTEASAGVRALAAVADNVLCRLAYPQDFLDAPALAATDFLPWTTGQGAAMLEAMKPLLSNYWIALDAAKARIGDWETMQALGRAQERVLTPFLDALEQTGRLDLARFLLQALAALLRGNARSRQWINGLRDTGPRLADRSATHRAALACVRQMDRLRQWERRARGVGYLDEGYAASQLWKQDWERFAGDTLHARFQSLAQQLDPMPSLEGAKA